MVETQKVIEEVLKHQALEQQITKEFEALRYARDEARKRYNRGAYSALTVEDILGDFELLRLLKLGELA